MTSLLQPLSSQVEIVDEKGRPTAQFINLLQQLKLGSGFKKSSTGALSFADQAAKTILANKTTSTGSPTACTISDILDFAASTRGTILYRGATGWQGLTPGTSGQVLQTNGSSADPTWVTPTGGSSGIDAAVTGIWKEYARQAVVNPTNLSINAKIDVVADHGGVVGIGLYGDTSYAYASRMTGTNYTVPTGCTAVVVGGRADEAQRTNTTYYSHRLYNVTKSWVVGSFVQSTSGNLGHYSGNSWFIPYFGGFTTNAANATRPYPIAGAAGDVLRAECWSAGDGNYRMQCGEYYIMIVDATTGVIKPIT